MWCSVRVFRSIRVRAVKCTIERLGGVRENESLELCESFWMHTIENSQEQKCLVRVPDLESRKCTSENLELCESFWRCTIENFQVHQCLVVIRLKISEVHDFKLKCSHSMQDSQFSNSVISNSTPPMHHVCMHTTLRGGNSLILNPISAAGWWNPPFLQVFSLSIGTDISRSTP